MTITDCTMVCTPIRHDGINISESTLTGDIRNKPVCRPGGIGTLIQCMMYIFWQINCPTFGDLEYRSQPLDQVEAAHRDRHIPAREKIAGKTTAAKIFGDGWI